MDQQIQETPPSTRVQFGKTMATTIAIFVTTKVVEGVYDALIQKSKKTTTVNSETPEMEQ